MLGVYEVKVKFKAEYPKVKFFGKGKLVQREGTFSYYLIAETKEEALGKELTDESLHNNVFSILFVEDDFDYHMDAADIKILNLEKEAKEKLMTYERVLQTFSYKETLRLLSDWKKKYE